MPLKQKTSTCSFWCNINAFQEGIRVLRIVFVYHFNSAHFQPPPSSLHATTLSNLSAITFEIWLIFAHLIVHPHFPAVLSCQKIRRTYDHHAKMPRFGAIETFEPITNFLPSFHFHFCAKISRCFSLQLSHNSIAPL